MKIGLFGGSFNPPHNGHLAIASQAMLSAQLDQILWIPSARPPHKRDYPLVEAEHRLQMTRLAVEGVDSYLVSDLELRRPGPSYTYDTIVEIGADRPDAELRLIIGGDSLQAFETWHKPTAILDRVKLLVYDRAGCSYDQLTPETLDRTMFIEGAVVIEDSSTEIRAAIADNRPFDHVLPEAVAAYIREHRLYLDPLSC